MKRMTQDRGMWDRASTVIINEYSENMCLYEDANGKRFIARSMGLSPHLHTCFTTAAPLQREQRQQAMMNGIAQRPIQTEFSLWYYWVILQGTSYPTRDH